MKTEIDVNPDMISWAITRAGFQLQDFLDNHPTVFKWLEKVKKPTVKQLEDFAKAVHIPFGYLFLNEPPSEVIPFPFFRTGKSAPLNKVSLNVYDTILILQRRQEWLVDYLLDNGQGPLAYVGKFTPNADYLTIVEDIRKTLKLDAEWAKNFKTLEDTLNHITEKIEGAGIIVNFNGVVENNTHRNIPVEECRGFVLVNAIAPFMFVNAADAKAAQLFTIVHELAHVWQGVSAGFNNEQLLPANDPVERLCDLVAAEFLVPAASFLALWEKKNDIVALSRYFKVSQLVIARRALDLGKFDKSAFFTVYNAFMERVRLKKEEQGSGGNFYATARKRISVSFASYVNQAVKQEKILYRDAYRITGLKGDTYNNFVTQHLY
jgi:Zn-dependent peptidase ImmA (M78 family)